MSGAARIVSIIVAAALGSLAHAKPARVPDPVAPCASAMHEWAAAQASEDSATLKDFLARAPQVCRALRSEVQGRIAEIGLTKPLAPTDIPQGDADAETALDASSCADWRAYKQKFPRGEFIQTANLWLGSDVCAPPAATKVTPAAKPLATKPD
jgi:hypothetical protein